MGIPVSTTHTITGAIVGVGSAQKFSAVRWGVAGGIVWAWILTIPFSAVIAALFWWLGTFILSSSAWRHSGAQVMKANIAAATSHGFSVIIACPQSAISTRLAWRSASCNGWPHAAASFGRDGRATVVSGKGTAAAAMSPFPY